VSFWPKSHFECDYRVELLSGAASQLTWADSSDSWSLQNGQAARQSLFYFLGGGLSLFAMAGLGLFDQKKCDRRDHAHRLQALHKTQKKRASELLTDGS
jgi:hypothetical protein